MKIFILCICLLFTTKGQSMEEKAMISDSFEDPEEAIENKLSHFENIINILKIILFFLLEIGFLQ